MLFLVFSMVSKVLQGFRRSSTGFFGRDYEVVPSNRKAVGKPQI